MPPTIAFQRTSREMGTFSDSLSGAVSGSCGSTLSSSPGFLGFGTHLLSSSSSVSARTRKRRVACAITSASCSDRAPPGVLSPVVPGEDMTILNPNVHSRAISAVLLDNSRPVLVNQRAANVSLTPGDMRWSPGAQKILSVENAGGDSILSEALSFEIFSRAFGCSLLETEMEVHYFPRGSSIIDYTAVVEEDDIIVGVSVTRCMDAPHRAMDADGALRLIRKKMRGLLSAEANISKLFAWDRSVLHVLCDTEANADLITAAYAELDAEEKDNVVVVISTVDGAPWAFESTRGKKKADQ